MDSNRYTYRQYYKLVRIALIAMIGVFTVLSFGPCIYEHTYYGADFLKLTDSNVAVQPYTISVNYMCFFCCIISALEIGLLVKGRDIQAIVSALILNVVKTVSPLFLRKASAAAVMNYMETFEAQYTVYSYTPLGYAVIAVGCINTALYILLCYLKIKETKELAG